MYAYKNQKCYYLLTITFLVLIFYYISNDGLNTANLSFPMSLSNSLCTSFFTITLLLLTPINLSSAI